MCLKYAGMASAVLCVQKYSNKMEESEGWKFQIQEKYRNFLQLQCSSSLTSYHCHPF